MGWPIYHCSIHYNMYSLLWAKISNFLEATIRGLPLANCLHRKLGILVVSEAYEGGAPRCAMWHAPAPRCVAQRVFSSAQFFVFLLVFLICLVFHFWFFLIIFVHLTWVCASAWSIVMLFAWKHTVLPQKLKHKCACMKQQLYLCILPPKVKNTTASRMKVQLCFPKTEAQLVLYWSKGSYSVLEHILHP